MREGSGLDRVAQALLVHARKEPNRQRPVMVLVLLENSNTWLSGPTIHPPPANGMPASSMAATDHNVVSATAVARSVPPTGWPNVASTV